MPDSIVIFSTDWLNQMLEGGGGTSTLQTSLLHAKHN